MSRELADKWPFNNPCLIHINQEENERIMKGKLNSTLFDRITIQTSFVIIYCYF